MWNGVLCARPREGEPNPAFSRQHPMLQNVGGRVTRLQLGKTMGDIVGASGLCQRLNVRAPEARPPPSCLAGLHQGSLAPAATRTPAVPAGRCPGKLRGSPLNLWTPSTANNKRRLSPGNQAPPAGTTVSSRGGSPGILSCLPQPYVASRPYVAVQHVGALTALLGKLAY